MSYITVVNPVSAFCGKTFDLDTAGNIIKHRAASPAKCLAYTVACPDLATLGNIINSLHPGMAIILGYVPETIGEQKFHLWSVRALEDIYQQAHGHDFKPATADSYQLIQKKDGILHLPRLKQLFKPSPFFCLDRDIDTDAPPEMAAIQRMDNAEFVKLFCSELGAEIGLAFSDVTYLAVESSSGQVYQKDGTPYAQDAAAHIFFQAADADDLERFNMAMSAQVIANGYSYHSEVHNKNGGVAFRKKLIYDQSVFTVGRLFFESSPRSLSPELVIKKENPILVNGLNACVDTAAVRDPNQHVMAALDRQNLTFKGSHYEADGLTEYLVIETEDGPMTVGHYRDNYVRRLRCQTPFRTSDSWAAYLNRHDDGGVFLWDEGTRTKYTLVANTEQLERYHKAAMDYMASALEMSRLAEECAETERQVNEAFTVIDEPSEADILEAQALALAEEYDAEQRNDEPPSDSALIAKVRAPADDFDARSFEDWMNADLRTPEEMTLWGDAAIIRGGISLLGGAPKVGKSTLLLQLLMAAACGGEFLGHHFNTPSVVLWIQGELKPEFFRSRMLEARAAFTPAEQELIKKNLIITRNCSLELNGVNAFAYSALIQKFKPDLVAIDPIRNLVVLKNENDASEMKKALLSLQKTAIDVDPDTSVLCVHHTRKDAAVIEGKSNTVPHDLYAGSGALRGIYDFGMIMLNDAQHNQTKSIHFESRNGPNMDSLTLRREGHEFLVGGMMEHAAQEFIGENKEGAVVGIVTQVLIEHKYFTERTAGEWQAVRDMAKNRLESLGLHSLADKTIKKYCEDSGVVHFFKSNGNKFYAYYRTTMLD